eukprot:CAMPEP_0115510062 /NCGR_PEP_ID=MMETSP0271-20121206/73202_1 /TAXON_ID=71861 /ORGANISM="Scrippsiella trochoidea, Strain CCMP3099" /LENGTH=244 /DNA_ID=CAMNT_0002939981 /DNA_START=92 /DNA_END=824 /DNA_ORIENTATION=+
MTETESQVPREKQFAYYDQYHTTGTDIKHSFNALAAVTIGKDTTWRDHTQGCYRMRGIEDGQRLNLLIPPQVVSTVANDLKGLSSAAQFVVEGSVQKLPVEGPKPDEAKNEKALCVVASWLLYRQIHTMKVRFTMLQFQDLANIWRRASLVELTETTEALAARLQEKAGSAQQRQELARQGLNVSDSREVRVPEALGIWQEEVSFQGAGVATEQQRQRLAKLAEGATDKKRAAAMVLHAVSQNF